MRIAARKKSSPFLRTPSTRIFASSPWAFAACRWKKMPNVSSKAFLGNTGAQQSYSESDKLFEKAHNTLETMLGAGVPELPFQDPPTALPLPREASITKGG